MHATSSPPAKRAYLTWFGALLLVIVALRLYTLYWGFWYDGFLVPPGGDPVSHWHTIKYLLAHHAWHVPGSGYPPLYHDIIALIAKITARDGFAVMKSTAPLLVGLSIIALYVIGKKWFNPTAGIIGAALLGLASGSMLLRYGDGNYPNLLGSGVFMLLSFTYIVLALRERPYYNGLWGAFWLLLLAVTHHLSFIIALGVLVTFFIAVTILRALRIVQVSNFRPAMSILVLSLILVGALAYIIFGRSLLLPAFQTIFQYGAANFTDVYLIQPLGLGQYGETLGPLLWGIGGLGMLFAVTRAEIPVERRLFIMVWVAVIFLGSRFSFVGLPARFARELDVPLALCGGVLGAFILQQARAGIPRILATGATAGFILLNSAMLMTGPFKLPEGFAPLVWFTSEDQEKLSALQQLPAGATIYMAPSSPYYAAFLNQKVVYRATPQPAQYIFITPITRANPSRIAYPFFKSYDKLNVALEQYPYATPIKRFKDGAVIKQVFEP